MYNQQLSIIKQSTEQMHMVPDNVTSAYSQFSFDGFFIAKTITIWAAGWAWSGPGGWQIYWLSWEPSTSVRHDEQQCRLKGTSTLTCWTMAHGYDLPVIAGHPRSHACSQIHPMTYLCTNNAGIVKVTITQSQSTGLPPTNVHKLSTIYRGYTVCPSTRRGCWIPVQPIEIMVIKLPSAEWKCQQNAASSINKNRCFRSNLSDWAFRPEEDPPLGSFSASPTGLLLDLRPRRMMV